MPFSNLERYLFPDNVCSFGLCHVGSYDQNETDEEEVEEEVSPDDDPPSPVAEPKRVRFDESEPVIEYYNDNVRTPKKRNHRNLKGGYSKNRPSNNTGTEASAIATAAKRNTTTTTTTTLTDPRVPCAGTFRRHRRRRPSLGGAAVAGERATWCRQSLPHNRIVSFRFPVISNRIESRPKEQQHRTGLCVGRTFRALPYGIEPCRDLAEAPPDPERCIRGSELGQPLPHASYQTPTHLKKEQHDEMLHARDGEEGMKESAGLSASCPQLCADHSVAPLFLR
eukprot:CAMPEP_0172373628 /NCGR_PEP_ID=MMETSP1060-20121228/52578_1 /TAXON_ID=37318 /ORGANISM="Pseudo-nitzschia pungens, Strain cf. cingulata" /LENGTH=280 /DNA_ID=CAMNT_0013100019 /DNA_START=178 /DNA_END=1021 /DNA_ORIENTATION=-